MKKLLILLVACFLLSCSKKQEPKPVVVDSIAVEKPAPSPEQPKVNVWSSSSTGLPVGVVLASDCTNSGRENADIKDNYITIRKPDGVNEIVKDVDEDVFLNVRIGDIIQ